MKRLFTSLVFVWLVVPYLFSQEYHYLTWEDYQVNPKNLNTDTEYPPGGGLVAGWTTILGATNKTTTAYSKTLAIPFNFSFNGSKVTHYKVSPAGIVTFDTAAVVGLDSINEALPSAKVPNKSICIWGLGCWAGDYVVTKTFGTAPNRQFWIMFDSYHQRGLKAAGYFYGSIVLEETSNYIYLVEQRTLCVENGNICTGKTEVTMGIQLDKSNAIQLTGSPKYAFKSTELPSSVDNIFHEFVPGTRPKLDIEGFKYNNLRYNPTAKLPMQFNGTFRNTGTETITSVDVNYSVNGSATVTDKGVAINVAQGERFDISTKTPYSNKSGEYNVKMWLSNLNNSQTDGIRNNEVLGPLTLVDSFVQRRVLHETFTSSTCPPCKPGNEQLELVLLSNDENYTSIKYQFYFPGTGDPYTTQEGRNRGTFYNGIGSVPTLVLDGQTKINPQIYSEKMYQDAAGIPAFFSISPKATVTGKTVKISTDINALLDFPTGLVLYTAINEKITKKNVKTNGEVEFYHVMKKMLPTNTGAVLPEFKQYVKQTFPLNYTFNGNYRLPLDGQQANHINHATEHCVEDFTNLEVVQFIQDPVSKFVYQSGRADVTVETSTDQIDLSELVYLKPNPAQDYTVLDLSKFVNFGEGVQVDLYDQQGRKLRSSKGFNSQFEINTSDLAEGVYIVRAQNATQLATVKLVVSKM
ncbi:MAG TPA: T9SS type A sorting domain-containing protein [Saprospiraceae bacterium]|nr:T9SS type A sorting domain-containing protein [Saprospiraceae bacterium]